MKNSLQRGWWKPWKWSSRTWLMVFLAGCLSSPFMTRWGCLCQIPNVALPFDIEEVIHDDLPRDEDALFKYAEILEKLRRYPLGTYTVSFLVPEQQRDENWDRRLNQWLIDRRETLIEYQVVGAMPRANGFSLRTATFNTLLPLHQDLCGLVRFAESEAEVYERQGEFDQAWACHLAAVRSGNHADKPGIAVCCMTGVANRIVAFDGIAKWASDPALTAAQLKAARKELAETLAGVFSASESAKAEYRVLKNSLDDSNWPNVVMARQPATGPLLGFKRILLWCIGEPELSLRLERQLLANILPEIDKPRHLRAAELNSRRLVFELDPDRPRARGQMAPAELASAFHGTFPLYTGRDLWPADRQVDRSRYKAEAKGVLMMVLLAVQEFQRVHGMFPKTLDELVPEFLDVVPFDPMDLSGAVLHYRREPNGEAVIWSIGQNDVDDDGKIEGPNPVDIGYQIQVESRVSLSPQSSPVND